MASAPVPLHPLRAFLALKRLHPVLQLSDERVRKWRVLVAIAPNYRGVHALIMADRHVPIQQRLAARIDGCLDESIELGMVDEVKAVVDDRRKPVDLCAAMQFFRAQRGDDDERPLGVSSGELEQVDYGINVLLLLFDDDIAKKLLELIGEQKKIDPAGAETASQRRKPLINRLEGCQERVETIEREAAFWFHNLIESLADLEVINFSNGRVLETDFRKSLRSLLQREQRFTH